MVFSTTDARKIGYSLCKNVNVDTEVTPFTKINSKSITELNVKIVEDNRRENLGDPGYGNEFLIHLQKHNP